MKSRAFLKRGYSLNKIRYNLIKKGIDEKYIQASISKIKENESDPDFFSAIVDVCIKKLKSKYFQRGHIFSVDSLDGEQDRNKKHKKIQTRHQFIGIIDQEDQDYHLI